MRVIVVEKDIAELMMLSKLVGHVDDCLVSPYSDPQRALAALDAEVGDLILVDNAAPGFDGVEFVRRARAQPVAREVPILMIAPRSDPQLYQAALEAGVTDLIARPINPVEFQLRLGQALALRRAALRDKRPGAPVADQLKAVLRRERELTLALARAIEFRDGEGGNHLEFVARASREIGERLGLDAEALENLHLAAPLHDIGKIGLSDELIRKPGALTLAERALMQQHTVRGHAMLARGRAPMLRTAAAIALSHHERFDGAGYPHGLQGKAIPLEARIVAVADVFDALTSPRSYKAAWDAGRARDYVKANAGSQFDPDCVAAFLSISAPLAAAC